HIRADLSVAPEELAGARVECHRCIYPMVAARPLGIHQVRTGIAGAEIEDAGLGIDGRRHPHVATPMSPWAHVPALAGSRHRVEAPDLLARVRIVGGHEAAQPRVALGAAY